jgi:lipopolysaccharide export system protein LptA
MRKKIFSILLIIIFIPCLLKAEEGIAVRIAVLPFEVFSIEERTDLGSEIAVKLSKQLAINPYILISDFRAVQSVLREDEYATLGEERLKEIAKLLDANFLLFGSTTKIRDEISIDVQVFNNFPAEAYFKTFAEGTDIEGVIEEISYKVEQEIMDKAEFIPPSQRPKVKVKPKTGVDGSIKREIDITDFEKELAKELGIEEEISQELDKETKVIEIRPETLEEQLEEEPFIVSPEQQKEEIVSKEEDTKSEKKKDKRKKKRIPSPFEFDQPVNINADTMEYDNRNNRATFKGNVIARQGNIVMFADNMKVLYGDKGRLEQISALGNVKVIQGERIATGQKIVFYNDQQKIVVTGSPRVWQGDNVIHGKKITVFLKEDRSVVEGGPGDRASATIYPKKKKPKK